MNENNEQVPGGYYYEPLKDTGFFQTWLKQAGDVVGSSVGDVAGAEGGPALQMITHQVGSSVGGLEGETIGFYLDNANTILQNVSTFVDQLNDYNSWADPSADIP